MIYQSVKIVYPELDASGRDFLGHDSEKIRLFEQYKKLVAVSLLKMIRGQAHITAQDIEEVNNWMMRVFFWAVRDYDPDEGVEFSTYAISCLRGSFKKEMRRVFGRKGSKKSIPHWAMVSLDTTPLKPGEFFGLGKAEPGDVVAEKLYFQEDVLEHEIQALDPMDREIITQIYIFDKPYKLVMEQMGVERHTISRSLKRSLRTIRANMNKHKGSAK